MGRMEYSAGMVKHSFWFAEFRKVIQLLAAGHTLAEIKAMNQAENIFAAPTQARATQIFNTVSLRTQALDPSLYDVFASSDVATQKLIALIAVMQSDSLFFDFIYEVYREKLILGMDELTDSDVAVFFRDKQRQSEIVAKWQDYTLHRLGTCYKTLLAEAGLMERRPGTRKLLRPILDSNLEKWLMEKGMVAVLHALTGGR